MKVSVCITVFNEEKSISALLESLLRQTKKPNEIIIVDGGSKDKTVDIIRHYQKKNKRIRLLIEPGSVAHGRNVSIELARYPIIASTDAGCVVKKDWLEKITAPFKHKEIGLVAGFYRMAAKNSMQKAMNVYHGVLPQHFDPTSFLPSARSVAFRKKIWEKVGGYSEKLDKAGEDTLFFHEIVKRGTRIVRVGEAIVYWKEPANFSLKDSIKKFYQYAKGDAQAGIWWHPTKQLASHNIKILSIFARYLIGLVLLILAFKNPLLWLALILVLIFYIFWAFRKVFIEFNDWKAGLWGIILQFLSDFAVMAGFISGLVGKWKS